MLAQGTSKDHPVWRHMETQREKIGYLELNDGALYREKRFGREYLKLSENGFRGREKTYVDRHGGPSQFKNENGRLHGGIGHLNCWLPGPDSNQRQGG